MDDFEKLIVDGIVILVINLRRGTLNESKRLGELLDEEIESGCKKLIVDLGECEFIDSTFLGTLVVRYKKFTGTGGKLKLVLPSVQKGVIFTATNSLGFFNKYGSRQEAINSFASNK